MRNGMSLLLDDILSEKNPDIISDSYRDGLGIQMIWSYYGQAIFKNKLNSIATDIRNFSINLFNHWLIRDLLSNLEDRESLIGNQKPFRSLVDLKSGLIIFLENLLIYSMHYYARIKNDQAADLSGLLGSSAAIAKWYKSKENPKIYIDKENSILVRQLSLGINGRYKTPFIEMYIMDNKYDYNRVKNITENINAWVDIEKFFKGGFGEQSQDVRSWTSSINSLKLLISDLIKGIIYDDRTKSFNEIISSRKYSNIPKLLVLCFGSSKSIPKTVKQGFWKSRLGLTQGASMALYEAFEELSTSASYEVIVNKALDLCEDSEEKKKLEKISLVEPFLAVSGNSFNILCDISTKSFTDAVKAVEKIYEIYKPLLINDLHLLSELAPPENISHEANRRFKKLHAVISSMKGNEFGTAVQLLIDHHKEIVKMRGGGLPWVDNKPDRIIHSGRTLKGYKCNTPDWINDYYLSTLSNIYSGIEEK